MRYVAKKAASYLLGSNYLICMKSHLTQNINTILGSAFLASVGLGASLLIIHFSANVDEELMYLSIDHRVLQPSEQTSVEETSKDITEQP